MYTQFTYTRKDMYFFKKYLNAFKIVFIPNLAYFCCSALEHSGSLCCYNQGGHLLYSGDNIASSAPSRRHPWLQSDPHEDAPHVPTMSHWLHDVIPYYHCCKWQDNEQDCYGKFAENRLTVGCSAYDVSGQG